MADSRGDAETNYRETVWYSSLQKSETQDQKELDENGLLHCYILLIDKDKETDLLSVHQILLLHKIVPPFPSANLSPNQLKHNQNLLFNNPCNYLIIFDWALLTLRFLTGCARPPADYTRSDLCKPFHFWPRNPTGGALTWNQRAERWIYGARWEGWTARKAEFRTNKRR